MARLALTRILRQGLLNRLNCDVTECCRGIWPSLQARYRFSTHYETLGISKDATPSDIKKAYIEKTKTYHPDILNSENADEFLKIAEAYEVLSDINSRREYDFKKFGKSSDYNRFKTGEYNIPMHDTVDRRMRYDQRKQQSATRPKNQPGFDQTVKMALSGRERALLDYLLGALISICIAMYLISRYQRQNAENDDANNNSSK